jgi:putative transposase
MRRNRVEILLHFVWTTIERAPLVTDNIERDLYRCIHSVCDKLRCQVIALGGMPDHVHLAIALPTTITASKVMHDVKGISSAFARDHLVEPGEVFGWRDGYGVFSFSRSDRAAVIEYIRNQKTRHASGRLWPNAEDPDVIDN